MLHKLCDMSTYSVADEVKSAYFKDEIILMNGVWGRYNRHLSAITRAMLSMTESIALFLGI